MAAPEPSIPEPGASPISRRAEEDLAFIRDAMGRGAAFTCVPGKGGVAMGAVGLAAAVLAARADSVNTWLAVWISAAFVAFGIGAAAMAAKARHDDHRPAASAARRFALAVLPPLLAGAAITVALVLSGNSAILPGVWLLLYGCAVAGGGASSVPIVPVFGIALVILGLVALLLPTAGDALLGVGFGAGHVATGIVVARRHGG